MTTLLGTPVPLLVHAIINNVAAAQYRYCSRAWINVHNKHQNGGGNAISEIGKGQEDVLLNIHLCQLLHRAL